MHWWACAKRACRTLCLAAAAALVSGAALALEPNAAFRDYAIDNWSITSGLPQISVFSITQDRDGYLWVATQTGISRFDGLRFHNFDRHNSNGVDPSEATASFNDRTGRLWFGTPRGLLRYDQHKFSQLKVGAQGAAVHALAETLDGELWAATAIGVMRVRDNTLLPISTEPGITYSLARDGESMWVGALGAVRKHSAAGVVSYPLPAAANARVTHVVNAQEGLWLGTNTGLWHLPRGATKPQPVALLPADGSPSEAELSIEGLFLDRDLNLWIGTKSSLYRRRPNGEVERISDADLLHNAYIISAFEDREGNLWLGSRTEGLFRAWNGWVKRLGQREGFSDPLIWSIARDPAGRIVFGSNSNIVRLGENGLEEILSARQLPGLIAYELNYDARGRLWIGMRAGLAIWRDGVLDTPPAFAALSMFQVNVIVPVQGDGAWIGTSDGLYSYAPERGLRRVEPEAGVPPAPVRSIYIAGDGSLLMGTENGVRSLLVAQPGDLVLPKLTAPSWAAALNGVFVTSIINIRPGLLGLGTRDGGIGLLADQSLAIFDTPQGLPSRNAWTLQVLDEHLYVSTVDGVWRVPIAKLPDPAAQPSPNLHTETVLGRFTGLQKIHCCNGGARARALLDGQSIWYPGVQGAVRVDTQAISPPSGTPTVVVEGLRHAGKWYPAYEAIVLEGGRRDLELEFTGLSFRNPTNLHFHYKLVGYDTEWQDAGARRNAFYTNLAPGQYRFQVRAVARHQVSDANNSEFPELAFYLVPRWYERSAVHAASIAALLLLAASTPLWMRARYRRGRQLLEAEVAARTRELSQANVRQGHANDALNSANEQLRTQIQDRLTAELALQQRNADLQALNQKLEGTQIQLLQSEKMAVVGQLAAGVAHEINNPIGFVQSNLGSLERYLRELLAVLDAHTRLANADLAQAPAAAQVLATLQQQLDLDYLREDAIALLAESQDGISRVRQIVLDLKNFSRVGNSAESEWQSVDLRDSLESTLNLLGHELRRKAEVVRDFAPIPWLECQPYQLNQVFLNLLVNAGQAIEQRGTITVRTRCDARAIQISISDTGSGMSEAQMRHIFEPFYTSKQVGKGTGLGLSVAYGIVAKHGGRIEVTSALGVGSTFTVHLPLDPGAR